MKTNKARKTSQYKSNYLTNKKLKRAEKQIKDLQKQIEDINYKLLLFSNLF